MPWSTSSRRTQLPHDWASRRARLLRDQPTCTCPGCHHCAGHPCTRPATDADHLGDRHDHNHLGAKCHPCHDVKTQHEAQTARRALLAKARHPTERHPGLT